MLVRFDPFQDADLLFDGRYGRRAAPPMPIDAYRRGEAFFVHVDVPGVDPDTIELTVEDDVLSVKAERTWQEQEGDELFACERPQGTFERDVYLGPSLDRDHVEARVENGVLTVRVPVLEAARHHKIPISSTGRSSAAGAGSSRRSRG